MLVRARWSRGQQSEFVLSIIGFVGDWLTVRKREALIVDAGQKMDLFMKFECCIFCGADLRHLDSIGLQQLQ